MTNQEMKLWTVAELREALGVSERTIWRMVKQELIEVKRFGRSVRIPHKEVLRLIQEGSRTHPMS